MPTYIIVWISFGLLSPFLLAGGTVDCSEKEALLKPKPSTMKKATECLVDCSRMTYRKKLQLQDDHNIRIRDSSEGDHGEFCWPTKLQCFTGESFLHAYVVLPVDVSEVGHEQLEVITTAPTVTTLHIHSSPSTIADSCGLRYEVTAHFSTPNPDTSFCVQIVTQEGDLGDSVLNCPPSLVTFWQRNPNQSSRQGSG